MERRILGPPDATAVAPVRTVEQAHSLPASASIDWDDLGVPELPIGTR